MAIGELKKSDTILVVSLVLYRTSFLRPTIDRIQEILRLTPPW